MIESKDWANSLLACFPSRISAFLSWLYSSLNSFHVMEKMTVAAPASQGPYYRRPQR